MDESKKWKSALLEFLNLPVFPAFIKLNDEVPFESLLVTLLQYSNSLAEAETHIDDDEDDANWNSLETSDLTLEQIGDDSDKWGRIVGDVVVRCFQLDEVQTSLLIIPFMSKLFSRSIVEPIQKSSDSSSGMYDSLLKLGQKAEQFGFEEIITFLEKASQLQRPLCVRNLISQISSVLFSVYTAANLFLEVLHYCLRQELKNELRAFVAQSLLSDQALYDSSKMLSDFSSRLNQTVWRSMIISRSAKLGHAAEAIVSDSVSCPLPLSGSHKINFDKILFLTIQPDSLRQQLIHLLETFLSENNIEKISGDDAKENKRTSFMSGGFLEGQNFTPGWILESHVSSSMLKLLKGDDEEYKIYKKDFPHLELVDRSSLQLRAASVLCPLAAAKKQTSIDEKWLEEILRRCYQTDDLLLKMASMELIISQLSFFPNAVEILLKGNFLDLLITDLIESPNLGYSVSVQVSVLKLICAIIERNQYMTESLLKKNNSGVFEVIKDFVTCDASVPDSDFRRTAGISAVGSIAAFRSIEGVKFLDANMPDWISELGHRLSIGNDKEIHAVLLACIRILGGSKFHSTGELALQEIEKRKIFDREFVPRFSSSLSPIILTSCLNRPFEVVREISFRIFEALMDLEDRLIVELIGNNLELQLLVFAPLVSDPPTVRYAKHSFVKKAWQKFGPWIKKNSDQRFSEAVDIYANSSPYVQPPQYKDVNMDIDTRVGGS